MKNYKKVYIVSSLVQNNFLVFGTKKRAQEEIERSIDYSSVFDKSKKEDLYITTRVVF